MNEIANLGDQESRTNVMDLQSKLEIAEEEVRPIRQHAMEMEGDLDVVLDGLVAMGRRKGAGEVVEKAWGVVEKYRGDR